MSDTSYPTGNDGQRDDLKDYAGDKGIVTRWLKEIDLVLESKKQRAFERQGERIVKRYKNDSSMVDYDDESGGTGKVMFNVLWANVQVLAPTLFCRLPKTVVERMFGGRDDIARVACMMAENAITYNMTIQQDRAYTAISGAVLDRLLPGRGNVWFRYDAEFEDATDENGEPIMGEDDLPVRVPKPNSERVVPDPLHWKDFFTSAARNRYETRWVARRSYMTKSELETRFGKERAAACDLSNTVGSNKKKDEDAQFLSQAEVFEIWDIKSKRVYWISPGCKDFPLDVKDDPLRLEGFFPCPGALLATTTTDSTYPTPDFKIYERLADELDYLCKRLSSIVECVRVVAAAADSFTKDLQKISDLDDGDIKGIKNWAQFLEKGGIDGAISWMPFDKAAAAIPIIAQRIQETKNDIYEVVGIPDIVRGSSDPTETLGAQQMKGHWTSVRIQSAQADVQRFCRECCSIMGQIIFEPGLFGDETIAMMCGWEQWEPDDQALFPQALQLLRDDRMRTFRINIETDSTIAIDESANQERWMNFLQAVQALMGQLQSVVSFRPELLHPMVESCLAAVRSMRTGRAVEGSFQKALDQIEKDDAQKRSQPPPPPPPDPLMVRAQADMQKAQTDAAQLQWEMQKYSSEYELKTYELDIKASEVQTRQQIDQMDRDLKAFQVQFEQYIKEKTLELEGDKVTVEKYRALLDEKEKYLEEARLSQEARINAEAENRKESTPHNPVQFHVHTDQPVNMVTPPAPPAPKERPKRKIHRIRRTPEGLEGETFEADDEPQQAGA